MTRFIDPFLSNNLADANILNDVADGEDAAVNEILELVHTAEISLMLPYSVQCELQNARTPVHVQRAANLFPFSMEVQLTEGERHGYRDLVDRVKGDAEEKNIAPDLFFHVYEAAKYGGYFVTRDKRLLARRAAIASILDVEVVTPSTFLDRVAQARHRDAEIRR